jgi:hypothetical protein
MIYSVLRSQLLTKITNLESGFYLFIFDIVGPKTILNNEVLLLRYVAGYSIFKKFL